MTPRTETAQERAERLARDKQALDRLAEDFPHWLAQHLPPADLPWEAKRRPSQTPARGGFTWLCADSPERLRDLLAAAQQVERQLAEEDAPRHRVTRTAHDLPDEHLHSLAQTLSQYDGIAAQLRDRTVYVTMWGEGGTRLDRITCVPRPDDGGRLWFFDHQRQPVAPAGHPDAALDVARHLREGA